MKDQLQIPGLENPEKPAVEKKRPALVDMEKRVAALELEVALLRIQMEVGRGGV